MRPGGHGLRHTWGPTFSPEGMLLASCNARVRTSLHARSWMPCFVSQAQGTGGSRAE
jgi:hypothetical protein